jgi:hypothetical protein
MALTVEIVAWLRYEPLARPLLEGRPCVTLSSGRSLKI